MFPGERDLRTERQQLLRTVRSLDHEHLESGPTLCAGWSPRDVLAHLVGVDDARHEYVRSGMRVSATNERMVARWRGRPLDELLDRVEAWADRPATPTRLFAWFLLGDLAVHHQDILRAAGRSRDVPAASARAMLRAGVVLDGRTLLHHRLIPTDTGRPLGRGRDIRGTAEALGMWLCGRREAVAAELEFAAG